MGKEARCRDRMTSPYTTSCRPVAAPKLLYVTSSFPYGLNDVFFEPEVRELVRQGVDVRSVPVRPRGPLTTADAESLTLQRPLFDLGIATAALAETLRAPAAVASAFALLFRSPRPSVLLRNVVSFPKALWLARLARSWGASHIHANWAGPPSTVALIASRISGVPWSVTAHASDIAANNLLREKSTSARFVRSIAAAMMDRARETAPGIDESRWVLVRFGVDMPEPRPRREALNDPPVLLMAARFDPGKRQDLLIHATRRLLDDGVEAEVWLAGRGGPLEDEARQLALRLGLDDRIRFQGAVPRATVLEWLESGQIDAAVLPSDREGIPVALIEALAHCVPAIGTDVGGIPELLGDGCGALVPIGDADALAAAITRVLDTPELRERIVEAGRARVEREFAAASVVRRLTELFAFVDDEDMAAPRSSARDRGRQGSAV
jgi:colanic acid/amylovoran biosynthesis glycosyltransferase